MKRFLAVALSCTVAACQATLPAPMISASPAQNEAAQGLLPADKLFVPTPPSSPQTETFDVAGKVTLFGQPFAGADVKLFLLGQKIAIGTGRSTAEGQVQVTFTRPVLAGTLLKIVATRGGETLAGITAASSNSKTGFKLQGDFANAVVDVDSTLTLLALGRRFEAAGQVAIKPNGEVIPALVEDTLKAFSVASTAFVGGVTETSSDKHAILTALSSEGLGSLPDDVARRMTSGMPDLAGALNASYNLLSNLIGRGELLPSADLMALLSFGGVNFGSFGGGASGSVASNPLAQAKLSLNHGVPGQEIIVESVANSGNEVYSSIAFPGNTTGIKTRARRLDESRVAIVVPLPPKLDGSFLVRIVLTSGTAASSQWLFTIDPLPAAPVKADTLANNIQQTVATLADPLGASREVLLGKAAELPPAIRAYAVAQQVLNGPNNPNSLKAMLDGNAPILDGNGFNKEIFERLSASSGFTEVLQECQAIADSRAARFATSNFRTKETGTFALGDEQSAIEMTADMLNRDMASQAFFASQQVAISKKLYDTVVSILQTGEAGLALGEAYAGGAAITAPTFIALVGAFATAGLAMDVLIKSEAGNSPCELTNFLVEAEPTTLSPTTRMSGTIRVTCKPRSMGVQANLWDALGAFEAVCGEACKPLGGAVKGAVQAQLGIIAPWIASPDADKTIIGPINYPPVDVTKFYAISSGNEKVVAAGGPTYSAVSNGQTSLNISPISKELCQGKLLSTSRGVSVVGVDEQTFRKSAGNRFDFDAKHQLVVFIKQRDTHYVGSGDGCFEPLYWIHVRNGEYYRVTAYVRPSIEADKGIYINKFAEIGKRLCFIECAVYDASGQLKDKRTDMYAEESYPYQWESQVRCVVLNMEALNSRPTNEFGWTDILPDDIASTVF